MLSKFPQLRPSKGTIFAMAVFVGTFIYFFTRLELPSDSKK